MWRVTTFLIYPVYVVFSPFFSPEKRTKGLSSILSLSLEIVFSTQVTTRGPFPEFSFGAPLPISSTSSWGQEILKRKKMINTAGFVVFQILVFFPKPYAIYFSESLNSCSTHFFFPGCRASFSGREEGKNAHAILTKSRHFDQCLLSFGISGPLVYSEGQIYWVTKDNLPCQNSNFNRYLSLVYLKHNAIHNPWYTQSIVRACPNDSQPSIFVC